MPWTAARSRAGAGRQAEAGVSSGEDVGAGTSRVPGGGGDAACENRGDAGARVCGIYSKPIRSPETGLQEEKPVSAKEADFKTLERLALVESLGRKALAEASEHQLCKHHLQLVACSVLGPMETSRGQPHAGAHEPS